MAEPSDDWGEYRRLILAELIRLSGEIVSLTMEIKSIHSSDLASLRAEIAVLKFKSGLWGALAGAIPGFIAVAYVLISK